VPGKYALNFLKKKEGKYALKIPIRNGLYCRNTLIEYTCGTYHEKEQVGRITGYL
jgi:hypothetical protein